MSIVYKMLIMSDSLLHSLS